MTLPSTGTLSFSQVNVEITRPAANTLGLNDSVVRSLAAKTTANSTIGTADLRGKSYAFRLTLANNTPNMNLYSTCQTAGWNGIDPVEVTINSGVYIYGTVAGDSTPALLINGTWLGGVTLINNGNIVGRGGAGGAGAVSASFTIGSATNGAGGAGEKGGRALVVTTSNCTINNNLGTIGGGGGGGGGSGGLLFYSGSTRYLAVGGSGGSGGRSGITEATAGTGGTRTTYIGSSPSFSGGSFTSSPATHAGWSGPRI